MTVELRSRASLHHVEGGWFTANWHFSFDHHHDEAHGGAAIVRGETSLAIRAGAAGAEILLVETRDR